MCTDLFDNVFKFGTARKRIANYERQLPIFLELDPRLTLFQELGWEECFGNKSSSE